MSSSSSQIDENWKAYCVAAGIQDPVKALEGFETVPRYIRIRKKIFPDDDDDFGAFVASSSTTKNKMYDFPSFSLQRVPWLPPKSNFFSVHEKSGSTTTIMMRTIKAELASKFLHPVDSSNSNTGSSNNDKSVTQFLEHIISSMDASSFVALLALCPKKTDNVLDVCCAPGMKLISICDLVTSPTSVVTGIDASLDRALVCRSLLSQFVSRRKKVISSSSSFSSADDECSFGHCRLYLGDGCTFSSRNAPCQAEQGLRKEATDAAKLSRHQKYQLQRIRKELSQKKTVAALLPERRQRDDGNNDDDCNGNTENDKKDGTRFRQNQHHHYCLWESENCPTLWKRDDKQQQQHDENETCEKANNDADRVTTFDDDENVFLFDRVLVDAECTHDGSVSHIDKFHQANFGDKSPKLPNATITTTTITNSSDVNDVIDSMSNQSLDQKLHELYELQFRLLLNGFNNCRSNGGVLIYSTCSMSPKQNEDIVERFMEFVGTDKVSLVDPFDELKEVRLSFLKLKDSEKPGDAAGESLVSTCCYSEKLLFDDEGMIESLRRDICTVSQILPPCLSLHPSKSKTSVQFVAKFVKL